jgi:integrase
MSVDRITQRSASSLLPGQTIWDQSIKGFGIRKQRQAAVYVFKFRQDGRQRFITIGRHGFPWTAETARKAAKKYWLRLTEGRHPANSHGLPNPAFAEFAERYTRLYAEGRKEPRSLAEDRRNLDLHILPSLGALGVRDITRAQVAQFHAAQHARPVNANRCLSLISHIFAIAEKWDLRETGTNPCRGLDRFPEKSRERFLDPEEMARLGSVLVAAEAGGHAYSDLVLETFGRRSAEDWKAIACIRLLILTGARLHEVLSLQWGWINWDRGFARLPDSNTGAKTLPLPDAALTLLKPLQSANDHRASQSKFVLPGKRKDGHFTGIQQPWQRIRAAAGLDDVRLHDLRHCYASAAVANGESLYLVGAILGHRSTSTTQRYAHLAIDPIRDAANRIASRLVGLMSPAAPRRALGAPPALPISESTISVYAENPGTIAADLEQR